MAGRPSSMFPQGPRRTFRALADDPHREDYLPAVLSWVHEAGNPYFDWFFGGAQRACRVLRILIGSDSSEIAIRRVSVLLEEDTAIGGFTALPGPELARARTTDLLAVLKNLDAEERAGLAGRIAATKDLFLPVSDHQFYLSKVGLVRERRGIGLGRVLLEEFLRRGEEAGYRQFALDVCAENLPAVRLYRSSGFRVVRESEHEGMRYLGMILEL